MDTRMDNILEAILFYRGEGVSKQEIISLLGIDTCRLDQLVTLTQEKLLNTALTLIDQGEELALVTKAEYGLFLQKLDDQEAEEPLSKALLETLAIVIYNTPVALSKIEYIRGVQSRYPVRTLEMKGLIVRTIDTTDSRQYLYTPSIDTLRFLGISQITELPDYQNIQNKIKEISKS